MALFLKMHINKEITDQGKQGINVGFESGVGAPRVHTEDQGRVA